MHAHIPSIRPAGFLMLAVLIGATLTGCGSDDNPTAPGQEDPVDWIALTAVQDTYTSEADPNQNFGQNGHLRVGDGMSAFLQFDLQPLSPDAVITSAWVRLTRSTDGGATGAATVTVTHVSDDDWDENTATATESPAMGNEVLGSFMVAALASGRQEVVFTSALAREKTNTEQLYANRLLTLRLSSDESVDFLSAENPDADLRPAIEVTYADGTRVMITPLGDAWTSTNSPDENKSDSASLEVNRSEARTFVKFDLAALPSGAQLHMARVKMLASRGYAYGGDGKVYSHLVMDDSWSPTEITANNEPAVANTHCGSWWLWYNSTPRDAWGVNGSPLLRPVVQAEADGDGVLSLRFHSPGYRTTYYRTADADPAKRPVLEVVYTR